MLLDVIYLLLKIGVINQGEAVRSSIRILAHLASLLWG